MVPASERGRYAVAARRRAGKRLRQNPRPAAARKGDSALPPFHSSDAGVMRNGRHALPAPARPLSLEPPLKEAPSRGRRIRPSVAWPAGRCAPARQVGSPTPPIEPSQRNRPSLRRPQTAGRNAGIAVAVMSRPACPERTPCRPPCFPGATDHARLPQRVRRTEPRAIRRTKSRSTIFAASIAGRSGYHSPIRWSITIRASP